MTEDLNENERKVLMFFGDNNPDHGFPFDTIAHDMKMARGDVRQACRSLTAKGLAEFHQTLWSEDDGKTMGAGYSATRAGVEIAATFPARESQP